MFIRKEVKLHTVAGKNFIFTRNGDQMDMPKIISFNKSSVWLWNQLEGRDFTEEEALELLTDHYSGDTEEIKTNLKWWLNNLIEAGIIEL